MITETGSNLPPTSDAQPVLQVKEQLGQLLPLMPVVPDTKDFWLDWLAGKLVVSFNQAMSEANGPEARRFLDLFKTHAPSVQRLVDERLKQHDATGVLWMQEQGVLDEIPVGEHELASWLAAMRKMPVPTPESLDHYALLCGFGYKAANRLVARQMVTSIQPKLKVCRVDLPPHLPVTHWEIFEHLTRIGCRLTERWRQFIECWDLADREAYLSQDKPLQLGVKQKAGLTPLREVVNGLLSMNEFLSLRITDWLERYKPRYVIVRSTGMEDSSTLSNAGGNASESFIEPNAEAIAQAIAKVIASYFGERSISQRLAAHDRTLFEQPIPFVPVLIEQMIMEDPERSAKEPLAMLRSGVVFARPPEHRAGTVLIQVGLGNNEGVVTGTVAVDTFLVNDNGDLDGVVLPKPARLVQEEAAPGGESKHKRQMVMRPTDASVTKEQALPMAVLRDLATVARELSKVYGHDGKSQPLDIEYSVNLLDPSGTPTIYILQQRPLLRPNDNEAPTSYIDRSALGKLPPEAYVSADTLIGRNAPAMKISGKQICVRDRLIDAADSYEGIPFAVAICRNQEPETSHASVYLRGCGVVVMRVASPAAYMRLDEWAKLDYQLTVCPQRGVVVIGHKVPLSQGRLNYPMSLRLSLPVGFPELSSEAIAKEIGRLMGRSQAWVTPQARLDTEPLDALFETMATAEAPGSMAPLHTLITRLRGTLISRLKDPHPTQRDVVVQMMLAMRTVLDLAEGRLGKALINEKPQTLERLYPVRLAQAAVLQASQEVVNGHSFKTALQLEKSLKKLDARSAGTGGERLDQLLLRSVTLAAFSPERATAWIRLTNEASSDMRRELLEQVLECRRYRLLELYINCAFWPSAAEIPAVDAVGGLTKRYLELSPLFGWLSGLHGKLDRVEAEVAKWEDESYFDTGMSAFNDICRLWLLPVSPVQPTFRGLYQSSGSTGRLALLVSFHRALEVCDKCIKSLKGNARLEGNLRAERFALMLLPFSDMLKGVFTLFEDTDDARLLENQFNNSVSRREGYLARLMNDGNYRFGFSDKRHTYHGLTTQVEVAKRHGFIDPFYELKARPIFNVSVMAVLSKADLNFSAHWPTNLEEHFMTIHENVKRSLCFLSHRNGLDVSILPFKVGLLVTELEKKLDERLAYVHQRDGKVVAGINIALRQHSALMEITYNPARLDEDGIDVLFEAFGNDEHRRWDQLAYTIPLVVACEDGLTLTERPSIDYNNPTGVRVAFNMKHSYQRVESLASAIRVMLKWMTMSGRSNESVVTSLGQHINITWNKVPTPVFRDSPQLLTQLIGQWIPNAGDHPDLLRVATAGLDFLVTYKLEDYERGSALSDATGRVHSSLRRACFHALNHTMTEMGVGTVEVAKLLEDPRVQAHATMAGDLKALQLSFKPPLERLAGFLEAGLWYDALKLAARALPDKPKLLMLLHGHMAKSDPGPLADAVLRTLNDEDDEQVLELLPEAIRTHPALAQVLSQQWRRAFYQACKREFIDNANELWSSGNLTYAVSCIIGLSYQESFEHSTNSNLKGFDQYLGENTPYANYIVNNIYPNTTKIHKCASIHLIQAMESSEAEIRAAARAELKSLIEFYVMVGHSCRQHDYLVALLSRLIVFSIVKEPATETEFSALLKGSVPGDRMWKAVLAVKQGSH